MITKVEFDKANNKKPSLAEDSEVRYRGKKLTKQQTAILEQLGLGSTNPEIAKALGLSPRTVESHLTGVRKLISGEIGYRLGDRELVLFARDMLDGYEVFVNLQAQLESKTKLIEDWDEEEEEEPLELPDDYKTFNGVPVPKEKPRKYIPVNKIFDIEEFKVEYKTVVYQDGTYRLT